MTKRLTRKWLGVDIKDMVYCVGDSNPIILMYSGSKSRAIRMNAHGKNQWTEEPGAQLTEVKSGEVESQVELSRGRPSVTQLNLRAMAELQARRTEVETGLTTPSHSRWIEDNYEAGRKGGAWWSRRGGEKRCSRRHWKSMVQPGWCLTNATPEGRGSPAEPEGWQTTV